MTNRCGTLVTLVAAGVLVPPTLISQTRGSTPTEPYTFLRTVAGFSPADLAQLDRGEPIARVLNTDKREVAVVGAVRITASQARLFERFRDISSLKSSVVLEIGRFGTPPVPADLRGLDFEGYDLETIRVCKPGDCGVRLSTA